MRQAFNGAATPAASISSTARSRRYEAEPMRRATVYRPIAALVVATLTACFARSPVQAQPTATPASQSTGAPKTSGRAPCDAVLANIAPLYASGSDKTNFYALLLRSTDE